MYEPHTDPKWKEIDARCAEVVLRAIASFPKLLKDCEAEQAAAIVAELIKAHVNRPTPESDAGAALAEVIQIATEQAEIDARNRAAASDQPPATPPEPSELANAPDPAQHRPHCGSAPSTEPPPVHCGILSSGRRAVSARKD